MQVPLVAVWLILATCQLQLDSVSKIQITFVANVDDSDRTLAFRPCHMSYSSMVTTSYTFILFL